MMKPKSPKHRRRDNHKVGRMRCLHDKYLVVKRKRTIVNDSSTEQIADPFEIVRLPVAHVEPVAFVYERDINNF